MYLAGIGTKVLEKCLVSYVGDEEWCLLGCYAV
jgi:hypothetical protein